MLLAACTNDPTEDIVDVALGTLPEGTFVIDYTASTGDASTRATAAERIQSLDYLLYESTDGTTFTLKHRRSIPDIGETTVWPLNRETMTWKQRQALKDTLNTACQYKMVFVANADKSIWNKEVLQNVDTDNKFEDGRLVLPPRVFTESDMYYMWSNHDAPLRGSEYNKDNPAQMDILLQRMINKVEVKLEASLVETNPGTDIDTYLDNYLTTTLENDGIIFNSLQTAMRNLVSGISGIGMPNAINNFKNYVEADAQIERLLGTTDEHSIRNIFITAFKQQMIKTELVVKKLEWNTIDEVKIAYEQNGRASSIDFSKKSIASTDSNEDPIRYKMNQENSSFLFYCFGDNENDDLLNKIQHISFQDNNGNEVFNLQGTGIPQSGAIGGNYSILFTCDPFTQINDEKTSAYTATINFDTFIDWNSIKAATSEDRLKEKVRETLGNLEDVEVTFNYPCNPVIKWATNIVQ